MTPEEIDELERLMTAATPGPWAWTRDDASLLTLHGADAMEDHVLTTQRCMACADRGAPCLDPSHNNAAAIVALHNAAPALIAAAREVERLRAFVPRWRMKRYSPTAVMWRLFVGNTAIPNTGLHPTDAGRVFASGGGKGYPNIDTAARAVCARLGIPYVPVEVDDG